MGNAAPDIGLPKKMELIDRGSHIEIMRRWFSAKAVLMSIFAVFWNVALVFWFSQLPAKPPPTTLLILLLNVAVGIWATYTALAGCLNRTRVVASQVRVNVRHGPLPWFGNLEVMAGDLRQLYAKETVSPFRSEEVLQAPSFEVRAVTQGGRDIKLVDGLESQDQALFIEQKIESHLRIKDTPVPGEIDKPRA